MIDKKEFEKAQRTLKSFTDKSVTEFNVSEPYAVLVKRNGPPLFKDKERTFSHFEAFTCPELHAHLGFEEAVFEFYNYNYSVLFCEPAEQGSKYDNMDIMEIISDLSGYIYKQQGKYLFEHYSRLFDEDRDYYLQYRYLNPEFSECYQQEFDRNIFSVRVFNVKPEEALTIIECLQMMNGFIIAEEWKNNTGEDISDWKDLHDVIDRFYMEMDSKVPGMYTGEWADTNKDKVKNAVSYGVMCHIDFHSEFYNYLYTNLPGWTYKDIDTIDNFDQKYICELINKKRNPPKQEVL